MRTLPDGMREKVLAAADLFAERGLDGTKMEEIAGATGVPQATLYYYFDGKEAILAFLFGEILDEMARGVEQATATQGTAAERLALVVAAQVEVIKRYPAASRALQFDLGRAARIPLIADRTEAAFLGPVHRLLREGAKDGSLRPVQHPRLTATAILGTITTVGINALTLGTPRPTRHVLDELLSYIMHGVGA